MIQIRQWLLQIVLCGFLIHLCDHLVADRRPARLVRLAGGCLLILVVFRPFLYLDFNVIARSFSDVPSSSAFDAREAEEKNRLLLQKTIEAQTADRIEEYASKRGLTVTAAVTTREDGSSGLFLPYAVTVTGLLSTEEQKELSKFMEDELGIDFVNQRFEPG